MTDVFSLKITPVYQYDDLTQIWVMCERYLDKFFDMACLPAVLDDACRYVMSGGGKRIRPLLVMAGFFSIGGGKFCEQNITHEQAMLIRACLCVELLHGYSLVHDDLPCMDNDDLRRGRPTCHIVYGEGVALLVGDVLQSLAFEVLTAGIDGLPDANFDLSAQLLHIFGSRARRMVAGQFLDTVGEGKTLMASELQAIHLDKTGALIEASVMMGGVCAGANTNQLASLHDFARDLGLAFQVQDDVLDVVGDTAVLGKSVGSDEKLNKSTYVKLLGVENAKTYADELFLNAKHIGARIGEQGEQNLLCQLVDKIQYRNK